MFRSLIVGCGKIAGYYESMQSSDVYGYAKAYVKSRKFNIVGCSDIDRIRANDFSKAYGITNYSNDYLKLIHETKPDVVSISTPDQSHYTVCSEILLQKNSTVRLIVLEKPACNDEEEMGSLLALSAERDIPIILNHSRRFHPLYRKIKDDFQSQRFGPLVRVDAKYYGGWEHNGIHLVDVLDYIFNASMTDIMISERHKGYSELDDTISFSSKLLGVNAPVYFHGFLEYPYQIFGMDLFFEKGRLKVDNFETDVSWYPLFNNKMGESCLGDGEPYAISCGLSSMETLVQKVFMFLNTGDLKMLKSYLLPDYSAVYRTLWSLRG